MPDPERQYADPDTGEVIAPRNISPLLARRQVEPVPASAVASEHLNEIAAAMSKAQAAFPEIKKAQKVDYVTRSGQHIKYNYADMAAILSAIRKPLADNQCFFTQFTIVGPGGPMLITRLIHSSGQWIASCWPVSANGTEQEKGSGLTYAKRYQLSALLGIHAEGDDDGAGASAKIESAPPSKPTPRPSKPVSKAVAEFVDGIRPDPAPDRMTAAEMNARFPEPAPYAKGSEPPPDDDMGIGEYVGTPDKVTQNPKGNYFKVHFGNEWFGTFSKTNSSIAKDAPGAVRITYRTKLLGESKTPVKEIVDIRAE